MGEKDYRLQLALLCLIPGLNSTKMLLLALSSRPFMQEVCTHFLSQLQSFSPRSQLAHNLEGPNPNSRCWTNFFCQNCHFTPPTGLQASKSCLRSTRSGTPLWHPHGVSRIWPDPDNHPDPTTNPPSWAHQAYASWMDLQLWTVPQ